MIKLAILYTHMVDCYDQPSECNVAGAVTNLMAIAQIIILEFLLSLHFNL